MNAIEENLDPQWRQMVARFLVAVYSAVHRAADCVCGELTHRWLLKYWHTQWSVNHTVCIQLLSYCTCEDRNWLSKPVNFPYEFWAFRIIITAHCITPHIGCLAQTLSGLWKRQQIQDHKNDWLWQLWGNETFMRQCTEEVLCRRRLNGCRNIDILRLRKYSAKGKGGLTPR